MEILVCKGKHSARHSRWTTERASVDGRFITVLEDIHDKVLDMFLLLGKTYLRDATLAL